MHRASGSQSVGYLLASLTYTMDYFWDTLEHSATLWSTLVTVEYHIQLGDILDDPMKGQMIIIEVFNENGRQHVVSMTMKLAVMYYSITVNNFKTILDLFLSISYLQSHKQQK